MSSPGGPRVALVANNYPPVRGGSAVVYGNIARCAPDRVVVVAPKLSYDDGLPIIGWREHDRQQTYTIVRLPLLRTPMRATPPRGLHRMLFRAWDIGIRLRLTGLIVWLVAARGVRAVCVGELLASSWLIRLTGLLPGLKTIVYVHGEEITTDDHYDRGRRRARQALLASDAVVVVSRFTQQAVDALLSHRASERIYLIENGVDRDRYRPGPKSPALVAFHRLTDAFVFVSVCRLLEKKGIDHAIRAFVRVIAQHPQSRYLIVGTGPYEGQLRALTAELRLHEAVVFAGQVTDGELVEYYQLGDVFVMPNRQLANGDTEGFGLVFLEANGCGVPVIAGRDGGSSDAVQDGKNGLVVDGHSVDQIAEAMLRLMNDPALRAALRNEGLAAAARASWTEKTKAFLGVCLGPACECREARPAKLAAG